MNKLEHIALEKLTPYARNARTHSAEQVEKLAGSIREFGFVNPVLIDASGMIIAGHGRVMAAQRLKLNTVPCLRISHLTEQQNRAYILADNKIHEMGGWDQALLSDEALELSDAGIDIEILGFSSGDLDDMLNEFTGKPEDRALDANAAPRPDEESESEGPAEIETTAKKAPLYIPVLINLTPREMAAWRVKKKEIGIDDNSLAFKTLAGMIEANEEAK